MKRTVSPLGLAILLVWVLHPGPVYGYQDPPDDPEVGNVDDEQTEEAEKEESDDDAQPGHIGIERRPRRPKEDPRQLVKDLGTLREAMKERIELSAEQKEVIEEIFEEQMGRLEEQARLQKSGETDEDSAEMIRELREQMVATRESGDADAMKEIREQIRELMMRGRSRGATGMHLFLRRVADELTQDQAKTYRRILKRLKLDRFVERPGMALRQLMRAVMHPEMNLTEEQRQAIRELSREAFKGAAKGAGNGAGPEGRSPEMLAQITEELKPKIFAELTDEQRATVERLLKSDQFRRGMGGARSGRGGGRPPRP